MFPKFGCFHRHILGGGDNKFYTITFKNLCFVYNLNKVIHTTSRFPRQLSYITECCHMITASALVPLISVANEYANDWILQDMIVTFDFQWTAAIGLDYTYDHVGKDNFSAL